MPLETIQQAEIAIQNNQYQTALDYFKQAHDKGATEQQTLKGISFALFGLGDAQGAINQLNKYVTLMPKDGEAWRNLAVILLKQKQDDKAVIALTNAINNKKGDPFCWLNLIQCHYRLTQYSDALLILHQAKKALPNELQIGKIEFEIQCAIDSLTLSQTIDPQPLQRLTKLAEEWSESNPSAGIILAFKVLQSAVTSTPETLQILLELFSKFAFYYTNINLSSYGYAFALHLNKEYDKSVQWYYTATVTNPKNDQLYLNLGIVLRQLNRQDEAISALEKSAQLGNQSAKLHENLAIAYTGVGRLTTAIQHYKIAAEQMAHEPKVRFSYGIVLLLNGQFDQGWAEYQHRINALKLAHKPANTTNWTGQSLTNKHLIVIHEQGLGDTINFARYIPLLTRSAAKITLKVQAPLVNQLKNLVGAGDNLTVISTNEVTEPSDYFCTLMDLPGLFKANIANIPTTMPYLAPIAEKVKFWQQKLSTIKIKKVGLVWAGNPGHARDKERSLSLTHFSALFNEDNVQFISLQMGEPLKQLDEATNNNVLDFSEDINDFSDTAALISQLDLVITIDTSVAHMAGALNIPTWVLINFVPDWRWLMQGRSSIWYPSIRLFREQNLHDWSAALAQLHHEFGLWLHGDNWLENEQLFKGVEQKEYNLVRKATLARLKHNPEDTEALRALAMVADKQEQTSFAIQQLETLLYWQPFDLDAHIRIGQLYQKQQKFEQALTHFLTALPLQTHNLNLYILTAQCFHRSHRQYEAIALYHKVLEQQPNNIDALSELGSSYKQIGQHQKALDVWLQAQKVAPDHIQTLIRLGMQQLLLGHFKAGWRHYNERWKTDQYSKDHIYNTCPVWQGENVDTLLIYDEQGLGDTLQFLRYVWPAAQKAQTIHLLIKDKLHCLLNPNTSLLPTNVNLVQGMTFQGATDAHCPLMALPIVLGMESNPLAEQVPYLQSSSLPSSTNAALTNKPLIKHKTNSKNTNTTNNTETNVKVGLVWAGNPEHLKDQYRSIPLPQLSPLFETPNINWYSIQMGAATAELAETTLPITRLDDQINDFSDTANIMHELDLVITVDTSVAHLAGALNIPCWVLISADPDWRWLLNTTKSHWYPNMRLFRQSHIYQWSHAIQAVKDALVELALKHSQHKAQNGDQNRKHNPKSMNKKHSKQESRYEH
ncbi:tetratricopeptide repeat protein [Algibacillus agarilyticus]|uniref:tetratricopeptide repeat protein n=1 Tax=Algibacillus agarilyticus TaxID=2234133 RepID=UPI000DD023E7|nr:tetratricopeptide repeat protein [Algibacillus agarilyticus]